MKDPLMKDPLRRIAGAERGLPGWRVERKIPLPMLAAIAAQCASVLIWATYLEARVGALEKFHAESASLSIGMARLEERLEGVKTELTLLRGELGKR